MSCEGGDSKRTSEAKNGNPQYSVTIETGKVDEELDAEVDSAVPKYVSSSGREYEVRDVAWSYTRAALCYFVAMVATWVGSRSIASAFYRCM